MLFQPGALGYNNGMVKYYTKSGDDGFTGLLGEGRVEKHHPRTEAVGTIDEATAALGLARAHARSQATAELVLTVQRDLYNLMAEVSATPENAESFRTIGDSNVAWLEEKIEAAGELVPMPEEFILPGDSAAGAALALARTITRRAERRVVYLFLNGDLENEALMRYLNRLSSLCFVLELVENQAVGKDSPTLAKS